MKNQPDNQQESLWRRQLSDAERAKLRVQPDLELEARLTDALSEIPEAAVPSNFTSRVLEAVELAEMRESLATGWRWNWRALWPRVAVAAAVLVFAGASIQHYEASSRRADMAKKLAMVASTQAPSVDALENLDAIRHLSQAGHADGELLAALQ